MVEREKEKEGGGGGGGREVFSQLSLEGFSKKPR